MQLPPATPLLIRHTVRCGLCRMSVCVRAKTDMIVVVLLILEVVLLELLLVVLVMVVDFLLLVLVRVIMVVVVVVVVQVLIVVGRNPNASADTCDTRNTKATELI